MLLTAPPLPVADALGDASLARIRAVLHRSVRVPGRCAHIAFAELLANPIGLKLGPTTTPEPTLRGTSKSDTILNVSTQDSATRPHSRSTTST